MAEWQSGYAAACKAVYLGSIPGSASNKTKQLLLSAARRFFLARRSGVSSVAYFHAASGQAKRVVLPDA